MHKPRLLKNLPPFLLLTGALLIAHPASAQNLYVGSNSSSQTTNFTSGTNSYANTYVGYNAGATNNRLSVSGSGTVLTNSGTLYVGFNGSGNSLVISNGGTVIDSGAQVGSFSSSSNNLVLVTGTGSLWSNNGALTIYGGSTLTLNQGGQVVDNNSNALTVNGTLSGNGSVTATNGGVTIAYGGTLAPTGTNALTINGNLTFNSGSLLWNLFTNSTAQPGTNYTAPIVLNGALGTGYINLTVNLGSNVSSGSFWSNSEAWSLITTTNAYGQLNENAAISLTGNTNGITASNFIIAASTNGLNLVYSIPTTWQTSGTNSWTNAANWTKGTPDALAQAFIDNGATVLVTSNASALTLTVGNTNSGNTLIITNGGKLTVSSDTFAGYGSTSSNNSIIVTGAGSQWSNGGVINLDYSGSGSSLVISNGGTVIANNGLYADRVTVTGSNSLVTNGSGAYGNGDLFADTSLVISNGGRVVDVNGYVGNSGLSNNSIVTGSNSAWINTRDVYLVATNGYSLIVSSGAYLSSSNGIIGGYNVFQGGSNNSVTITGSGSLWSNAAAICIGGNLDGVERTNDNGLGGSGTLTIGSGATVISGSVIIASASNTIGMLNIGTYGGNDTNVTLTASSIKFATGSGTLNFNQKDTATIAAPISGSGTVQQLGSGTTILTGSNSYTGTTTVNAGVLLVDNTTGWGVGSGLTVNSNGIVGGSGSIAGAALINGLLDPARGSSNAMTLTFNTNVTLGATATTMIDLLSAGSYDKIKVGGTLNYGGLLDIVLGNTNAPGTYQFFSTLSGGTNIITTGSFSTVELTGLFGTWLMTNSSGTWNYANGTDSYKFTQASGQFTVTAVPEPSTYALFGLSALAVFVVLRRRGIPEEKRQ